MTGEDFIPRFPRPLKRPAVASCASAAALNLVILYEDERTLEWAVEMHCRVLPLVGADCIEDTWRKLSLLHQPEILQEATEAAIQADVIVVAVRAAAEVPNELRAWVNAWLPRRRQPVGALVALISVPAACGPWAWRTRDYLETVAHRGGLDFLPHERKVVAPAPAALELATDAFDPRPMANRRWSPLGPRKRWRDDGFRG